MRWVLISCGIVLLVLNALVLVPATGAFYPYLSGASLVLTLCLLLAILAARDGKPAQTKAESAMPVRPPVIKNQAQAEVVSFLSMLQDKGRLVDFLMDDIAAYGDAQVGAAARVVHEGCKAVLQQHFRIRPVRTESEGARVEVAAGYAADEYRLIGKIRGEAPFSGTLVHRGWKAETVELPRILRSPADRLPTIAPAEVELH